MSKSNILGEIYGTRRGIVNLLLLIRLDSLTSLNILAVCLLLPRAGSMDDGFDPRQCVAPVWSYNVAGPGRRDLRLRPGFAPG